MAYILHEFCESQLHSQVNIHLDITMNVILM